MAHSASHWEYPPASEEQIREITETGLVSRPVALVLASRQIGPEAVAGFLNPSLGQLTDPYLLPDTRRAAERLWQAIANRERILIYGDYDTDGITSAVLLSKVLEQNGAVVDCYLPHRIDDGYGLTPESLDKIATPEHSLLITVDCGITSVEAIAAANERGLDVVVTDHHEPGAEIPKALAVVDPKLPGSDHDLQNLAGVGVAFKVCHAFIKYGRDNGLGGGTTDLREYLDLVALGTVADIVPLAHENRCLVSYGLQVLSRQHRPGVRALCDIVNINHAVKTTDITYRLAPRLNAAGRMGDPRDSFELLLATNTTDAFSMAARLDARNRERQEIEATVLAAAEAEITAQGDMSHRSTVLVTGDEWHQGVIGIVASRLVRKYHRPTVVLAKDPSGYLCGSGRSVRRVNLVTILESCKQYLHRYGGHAMAAGLALLPENAAEFSVAFERAVGQIFSTDAARPTIEVCGEIDLRELDDRVFEELGQLEPFGHGNPEPIFATLAVTPERVLAAGTRHTRGTVRDRHGAKHSFIYFGRPPESLPPGPWSIAYTPQINTFNGVSRPQLKIIDLQPG